MTTRTDTFARDAGIDIGEDRGVFDEFHRIEVDRLRKRAEDAEAERAFVERLLTASDARGNMWKLAATAGWCMFGIALLSQIMK